MRVLRLRGGSEGDLGAGCRGQLQVSREEVGMEVGLDDQLDGETVLLGC